MICRLSATMVLGLAVASHAQVYKVPDPRAVAPKPFLQPDAPRVTDHRNAFVVVNLVSSRACDKPLIIDPLLKDAWGLALRPPGKGGHWWAANTATGTTTTYVGDAPGIPFGQDDLKVVHIPVGKLHHRNETTSQPTGTVYAAFNSGEFLIERSDDNGAQTKDHARFIFVTLDGTISAWANGMASSVNVIDRGAQGAMYTGIAISEKPALNLIYCCDFNNRRIDTFDAQWNAVRLAGAFTLPENNADYAIYNLLHHAGTLYAAFARIANEPGDAEAYPGYGIIAQFDLQGNHIKTFETTPQLNAPWGLCVAPPNFGPFASHLLVANFGDARLLAFNTQSGVFVDHLRDQHGKPIEIDGVWDVKFGNGETLGYANHLYFTAGPEQELEGLFGKLVPLFP